MGQSHEVFRTTEGRELSYLLHVPPPQDEPVPMILFLHGAGEVGSDPEVLGEHGIPKIAELYPDFPFLCVSPQCPAGSSWSPLVPALSELVETVIATHWVDQQRVYLTGISMGGAGAWSLGSAHPGRFAAVVPICGYGVRDDGFPSRVSALKNTPVWAFHGALDDIVPLRASQQLVDALRRAGGNVRFTVYPDVGHDSWSQTYEESALYDWLLEQRRAAG